MAEKLERIYTIPLRREFQKVPRWRRSKRAVSAVRKFIEKHMKSENVKIEKQLSEKLWERGAKNPIPRVKVITNKEDDEVRVQLFGLKFSEKKVDKDKKKAKKEKKKEEKEEKDISKQKQKGEEKVKPTLKSRKKNV